MADSNLYSQLKAADKITDDQHLKSIYKSSRDVIELYEALGGTKDELPEEIAQIRETYNVILFLDEYFRQTSMRIRNMLRGILNGKIGAHTIPNNVFIVYATNLEDQGIDEIPLNTQFQQANLTNPTKEEWFSWLVYKFEKDKKVKLNMKLINKFHHILEDSDLSHDDADNEVRTSPRRWEQLLLYINSSLPVKDEADAADLLTNVKTNFRNYLEGSHSDLAKKVMEAVAELIKDTSDITVSANHINDPTEWHRTLKHQIEQKMKLGEHRKYVPIIAGLPGVAKTTTAEKIAHDMDLRFIDIDVSTINAEDVVGLPLPKTNKDGQLETTFSLPGLYQQIMNQIKAEDKAYLAKLEKDKPEDYEALAKEYKERPFKYLIFFDELNRNSPKVFNAIRRVLLEKNFGPSEEKGGKLLELPKEAIVLGAINPHDAGAQELTDHMKDVLDVIEVQAHWDKTVEYLKNQKIKGVDDLTHDLTLDIIKKFANKFKTPNHNVASDQKPFHLDLGTDVYVSPREYTMLYIALARALERKLSKIRKLDFTEMTTTEIQKHEDDLRHTIVDALEHNLGFIFVKHGVEKDEFLNTLSNWILHSPEIDFGENLFYKKSFDVKENSLVKILSDLIDGKAHEGTHENADFVNFINNADVAKLSEDSAELISSRLKDEEGIDKYLLDESHPKVTVKGGELTTDPSEKVSLLENFLREVIIALYIHENSHDKIQSVNKSVILPIKQLRAKLRDILSPDKHGDLLEVFAPMIIRVDDLVDGSEKLSLK